MEIEQSHSVMSERSSSKEADDMVKLKFEALNTSEAGRVTDLQFRHKDQRSWNPKELLVWFPGSGAQG